MIRVAGHAVAGSSRSRGSRAALLSLSKVEEIDLDISQPQAVNQQESAFTVTLTLMKPPHWDLGLPTAAADLPVTVDLMASLESPPPLGVPDGTPPANPIFAPVSESVTFPAGVSTETVTVPITSSAATPGMAEIWLTTTAFTSSYFTVMQGEPVCTALYSSPAAVPPSITDVHLVTHGKLASAIVLGFNQPMAAATVENIDNYRILSRPSSSFDQSFLSGLFGGGSGTETTVTKSFPIAAATYDPSTSTATLRLKRPTKASSLYQLTSAYPVKGHVLTDLDGQPLAQANFATGGEFTIPIHPSLEFTGPGFAGPLKSTTQLGWDF